MYCHLLHITFRDCSFFVLFSGLPDGFCLFVGPSMDLVTLRLSALCLYWDLHCFPFV